MADKGNGEDGGVRAWRWKYGTTDIAAKEIQEGGDGSGGDAVRQPKRCGTREMEFWGKS